MTFKRGIYAVMHILLWTWLSLSTLYHAFEYPTIMNVACSVFMIITYPIIFKACSPILTITDEYVEGRQWLSKTPLRIYWKNASSVAYHHSFMGHGITVTEHEGGKLSKRAGIGFTLSQYKTAILLAAKAASKFHSIDIDLIRQDLKKLPHFIYYIIFALVVVIAGCVYLRYYL